MLSHVFVGITDFERAFAFYEGLMTELGLTLKLSEPEKPWAGWMQPGVDRPLFLIGHPYNSQPATPGNGQMIALLAPNRSAVDSCYARAIANGAQSEGRPGLRPATSTCTECPQRASAVAWPRCTTRFIPSSSAIAQSTSIGGPSRSAFWPAIRRVHSTTESGIG